MDEHPRLQWERPDDGLRLGEARLRAGRPQAVRRPSRGDAGAGANAGMGGAHLRSLAVPGRRLRLLGGRSRWHVRVVHAAGKPLPRLPDRRRPGFPRFRRRLAIRRVLASVRRDVRDPAGGHAHAYSHVNTFSSAAMAYAVSGDQRYLRSCVNAYDFLQRTQCYATGGYGPDERLMPPDGSLGRSLELYAGHAEIPCGTWAAFKLSRYLMSFTGEARFGDWIETLLYNGIGAALPTQPDGKTYYYGDYRLSSGLKQFYWHEWPCCSGTYLQTVADYHNVIYFRESQGLYVNLFVPSEATWRH